MMLTWATKCPHSSAAKDGEQAGNMLSKLINKLHKLEDKLASELVSELVLCLDSGSSWL